MSNPLPPSIVTVNFDGSRFCHRADGFNRVDAYATEGGNDRAYFYDSAGNDLFAARPESAQVEGDNFFNFGSGFDKTYAYSFPGNDQVIVYDLPGDDVYKTWSDRVLMRGDDFLTYAYGFDQACAYASSGNNQAISCDSEDEDSLQVLDWGIRLSSQIYKNELHRFDGVTAISNSGGDNEAYVEAVDYLFDLIGEWTQS